MARFNLIERELKIRVFDRRPTTPTDVDLGGLRRIVLAGLLRIARAWTFAPKAWYKATL
jgi:hypothetical protein